MTTRLLLASPREPSGVTWLINCFLELGIRCFRGSARAMWEERGGRSHLRPREEPLKRWLPALHLRASEGFVFRPGIELCWFHDWPDWRHSRRSPAIYFVRDPRDALYSRYRRDNPELGFAEYAHTVDAWSLLDRVDTWALFTRCWLAWPQVMTCRFEDYKADGERTLTQLVRALGLSATPAQIRAAVDASTFERARDAEQAYLEAHPEERTVVINRAGSVGSWRQLSGDDALVVPHLERRSADLLLRFGYTSEQPTAGVPDLSAHMDSVAWLRATPLRPASGGDPLGAASAARADALAFGRTLTPTFLERAQLEPDVVAALLCNLRDSVGADVTPLMPRYGAAASRYYYELLKRSRDPRTLRHLSLPELAGRLADRARRWAAGR